MIWPKKKLFLLRRLSVVCIEMACLCLFLLPCFAEQPFIEMIWLMSFLRAGNDPGTSHRNITQEHLTLMSSIHRFPLSCCSALVTQFLPQFPSWAKCISKNGLKSVSNPALLQFQICQNIRCEWIFYEYSLDSSAGCNSNHINALILIH